MKYDNSEVSMMLNRAAYAEDEVYSISTAKDGERKPDKKDAVAPFVDRLTREATITTVKTKEKPEGEYISISFPDYEMRLDFYPAQGKKNYIRQVYVIEEEEGQFEEVEGEDFVAEFADGKTSAADIMQEWYDSLKWYNNKMFILEIEFQTIERKMKQLLSWKRKRLQMWELKILQR